MKRILIVAVAALAAHSGAVLADNNWTFDDPFWSSDRALQSVEHTSYVPGELSETFTKYQQVDGYNH